MNVEGIIRQAAGANLRPCHVLLMGPSEWFNFTAGYNTANQPATAGSGAPTEEELLELIRQVDGN